MDDRWKRLREILAKGVGRTCPPITLSVNEAKSLWTCAELVKEAGGIPNVSEQYVSSATSKLFEALSVETSEHKKEEVH
jgi:hypothetical protein